MRVYRTMHDFDGMDNGQQLWQAFNSHGDCIAWMVADGEGKGKVADEITASIGVTPYLVSRRSDADRFAVMLRHNKNVKQMLDEAVQAFAKWWDEDYFETDRDWHDGYEWGKKKFAMPRRIPSWRNRHHYEHGAAIGLVSHIAKRTHVGYDFIEAWVIPYKVKEDYGKS